MGPAGSTTGSAANGGRTVSQLACLPCQPLASWAPPPPTSPHASQPASASGGSSRRRPPLSPRLQVHCAHWLHRLLLPPGGGGARLCQRDRSLLPAAHPHRPAQGVPPLHDSHPHRCGWPSDPRVRRAPAAAPTGSGTRPLLNTEFASSRTPDGASCLWDLWKHFR